MRLNLAKNEKVKFEIRKHWFIIFVQAFLILLLSLVPLAFFAILKSSYNFVPSAEVTSLLRFLYSVWILFMWMGLFILWTDWYFDVWIVTNKRIIDIEQKGLFRRDIASLSLDQIQDIRIEVRGIINTLLGIGDVYVQTAGEAREFTIRGARHPNKVRKILMEVYQKKIEEAKVVKIEK